MSSSESHVMDERRRKLLLGGASAALLQACGGGGSTASTVDGAAAGQPATDVPANATPQAASLNLADFGGVPGATPAAIREAFTKAYARLATSGGQLLVPAGTYDLGSYGAETDILAVDGLRNVTISAYGAIFRVNTTANVIPTLFYFSNPDNVTVAGAGFNDTGFDPDANWRGMYCVRVGANRASSGFRMVDCQADGAVGLFAFQSRGAGKYLMKDISVHGTVKNAYYGAGLTYAGDNAKVDLSCINVRRGCIAYGLRNAAIKIAMNHAADAPGSNGFIALACEGAAAGNVENVSIELEAAGIVRHNALVHFYHEQSEATGVMRNIDARVSVNSTKADGMNAHVFVFDHELPNAVIARSTARSWDQIVLRGSVSGGLAGRLVDNPSVSTAPGAVYVDAELAKSADMSALPAYFRVKTS